MKKKISSRNFYFLVVILGISTVQVTGISSHYQQDNWIPLLLTVLPSTGLMLLYARMMQILPGMGLYGMAEYALGKWGSLVVKLLMALHSIHVACLVMRSMTQFAHLTFLPRSPDVVVMVIILLPAIYIARSGANTLGKWGVLLFAVTWFTLAFNTLLAIPTYSFANLLPILEAPLPQLAITSFHFMLYPFGDAVLLLCIANDVSVDKGGHPYRCLILGTITAIFFMLLNTVRTILMLGPYFSENVLLSAFQAIRVIKLGAFLQRIEAVMGTMMYLFSFVKIALCIISAAKGISSAFAPSQAVDMTLPVACLAWALAPVLFRDMLQFNLFIDAYTYYTFPFRIVIPGLIWIVSECKLRLQGRGAPSIGGLRTSNS